MIEAYLRANKMFVDYNEVSSTASCIFLIAWSFGIALFKEYLFLSTA